MGATNGGWRHGYYEELGTPEEVYPEFLEGLLHLKNPKNPSIGEYRNHQNHTIIINIHPKI